MNDQDYCRFDGTFPDPPLDEGGLKIKPKQICKT
jgi:hypothetical protein